MGFSEIKSEKDLLKYKDLWKTIEKNPEMTVFQSYEWNVLLYRQWKKSLYNRIFSKVYIFSEEKMIVPLVAQKISFGFKWIGRKRGVYILGTDSYSDYLNIIYGENQEDHILDFIKEILKLKMPLYLSRIREDTQTYRLLNENGIYPSTETVAVEVLLDKFSSKEEYTKSLSKSTRQNLRTALNRMQKDNIRFHFEVIEGKLGEEMVAELLPIHLARIMDINKRYKNCLNRISNYFRRKKLKKIELHNNVVTEAMVKMDNALTVVAYCNNEIGGYIFGFRENEKIRIIQNCIKDEYKFYSPMFRGIYDFICELIGSTINSVDFTRGGEEYKYKLGGVETKLYSYVLVNDIE